MCALQAKESTWVWGYLYQCCDFTWFEIRQNSLAEQCRDCIAGHVELCVLSLSRISLCPECILYWSLWSECMVLPSLASWQKYVSFWNVPLPTNSLLVAFLSVGLSHRITCAHVSSVGDSKLLLSLCTCQPVSTRLFSHFCSLITCFGVVCACVFG